jgi:hypothetical protein
MAYCTGTLRQAGHLETAGCQGSQEYLWFLECCRQMSTLGQRIQQEANELVIKKKKTAYFTFYIH